MLAWWRQRSAARSVMREERDAYERFICLSTATIVIVLDDGSELRRRVAAMPTLIGRFGIRWKPADFVAAERAGEFARNGVWQGFTLIPPSRLHAIRIEGATPPPPSPDPSTDSGITVRS